MGVSTDYRVWNFLHRLLFCVKRLVKRQVFITNYSKNMGKTESNQIRGENVAWSCEVLGSNCVVCEDSGFLGYNTVSLCEWFLPF